MSVTLHAPASGVDAPRRDGGRRRFGPHAAGLLIAGLALACGGRPPAAAPSTHVLSGATMGTSYQVKVVAAELAAGAQSRLAAAVQGALDTVDAAMSTYRDDSELSRFNRHAAGTPMTLSPATFTVLTRALEIGRASGGAFDVTVGPLVNAWGFGRDGVPSAVLDDRHIAALRDRIGHRQLRLDAAASTVEKARDDVFVDLSGIAKGWAVDGVAATLAEAGFGDYLIEVGGEMRAGGRNAEGWPWRVGIERPVLARRQVQRIVPLDDGRALATSGDYRNYREVDGVRLSHIIDPRSGRPIGHRLASVSVVADECATADAWATALMVLGESGRALAADHGLAALFLIRAAAGDDFEEHMTPAFEALMAAARGPAPKETS